jgi:aminoglycoside phosphotransferase (APT) family kinase protein
MIPTDARLLLGLRRAVAQLSEMNAGSESRDIASSANALLDELTLRTNSVFYANHLRQGIGILHHFEAAKIIELSVADRVVLKDLFSGLHGDADQHFSTEFLSERIDALRSIFQSLVRSSWSGPPASVDPLWNRIFKWELEFAQNAKCQRSESSAATVEKLTQTTLEAYLRAKFKSPDTHVTNFVRLHGGLSKLTVLFDIKKEDGRHALVLRGDFPDRFLPLDLGTVAEEFKIVKIAFEAGLPIAEPLWLEQDEKKLGIRFMVSRLVPGKNYGSAMGVDKLPKVVARALIGSLAAMHAIPISRFAMRLRRTPLAKWFQYKTLADNTRQNTVQWLSMVETRPHISSPALAAISKWLLDNVPDDQGDAALVHCDFAPHNVLVDEERVTGILDWESARIGDPAEDLSYFLQRIGSQVDRAEALLWYRDAGGPEISEYRLRYFDVFHVQKIMIACIAAQSLYATESARNEWTPLAFQHLQIPLGMQWKEWMAAAVAAKR